MEDLQKEVPDKGPVKVEVEDSHDTCGGQGSQQKISSFPRRLNVGLGNFLMNVIIMSTHVTARNSLSLHCEGSKPSITQPTTQPSISNPLLLNLQISNL